MVTDPPLADTTGGVPRGGDGSGWPLAQALATGDQRAFAVAIRTSQVAVPSAPESGPNSLLVMPGADGARVLLAFSHPGALRQWDQHAPVGTVRGVDLATTAAGVGADEVCFDVAGPAPVRIGARALQDLIDGVVPQEGAVGGASRLAGPLQVRADPEFAALVASAAGKLGLPAGTRVLAVRRRVAGRTVRAVMVQSEGDARLLAASLPGVLPPGEPVDVMPVERAVFDDVARHAPDAVVRWP